MLQGVQKRKEKKKIRKESTKARKILNDTKTTRIKVRNLVRWLKTLIVVMRMKWFTLL